MTELQLRIIKRAIKTRLANGEDFNKIILSYPKLTEEETNQIKNELCLTKGDIL